MTNLTSHDSLFQAVCDNPDDRDSMQVLADWYEERSDDARAECWRYFATSGKWPEPPNDFYVWWLSPKALDNKYKGNRDQHIPYIPHMLHEVWHERIKEEINPHEGVNFSRQFLTYSTAWTAAVEAYVRLTPEERREVKEWKP